MGRRANFLPKWDKGKKLWYVSLPPWFTGKARKREYFSEKRDAGARSKQLMDMRDSKIEGMHRHATPAFIMEALECLDAVTAMGFSSLRESLTAFCTDYDRKTRSATFGELMDAYRIDHWGNWSEPYKSKRWYPFYNRVGELSETSIAFMDTDFWRKWLEQWRNQSAPAASTYNQTLSMLRSIFGHEKSRKTHSFNPLEPLPSVKDDSPKDIHVLEPDHARALMLWTEENDPELVPYFALGLFAGLRPDSELKLLKFENINWKEKTIDVKSRKTKKRRHIPMEDNLIAWLSPYNRKKGFITPKNFVKRFNAARNGAAAVMELKSFPWGHDVMRHSYASYYEAFNRDKEGCRDRLVYNLGHTDFGTFDQYYRNDRPARLADLYFHIEPSRPADNVVKIG